MGGIQSSVFGLVTRTQGLCPKNDATKNPSTFSGLKARHVIAWVAASVAREGPGQQIKKFKPCKGVTIRGLNR